MQSKQTIDYLNEFKSKLQEMFDEFDHTMSSSENDVLYHEAYNEVGEPLKNYLINLHLLCVARFL